MAQSFFLFHLLTLHPSGARGNAWEQMSLWALGQKLSAEIGKLTVKAHEKSVHTRARYTSDPGAPNSIAAAQDPLESPLNRNPFPWGQPGAATASQGMHFWEVPDMWLCQKVWLWQGEVCGAAGALRVFWDSRSSSWVVLSRRWLIWRNEVWATAGNPTFGVLATFTYSSKQVGWLKVQKLSINLQKTHGEITINGLYEMSFFWERDGNDGELDLSPSGALQESGSPISSSFLFCINFPFTQHKKPHLRQ